MAKYKPQHSRLIFIDQEISTGEYPMQRIGYYDFDFTGDFGQWHFYAEC